MFIYPVSTEVNAWFSDANMRLGIARKIVEEAKAEADPEKRAELKAQAQNSMWLYRDSTARALERCAKDVAMTAREDLGINDEVPDLEVLARLSNVTARFMKDQGRDDRREMFEEMAIDARRLLANGVLK